MASKRFLTLDIGASTLKMGEFVSSGEGNLRLVNFGFHVMGGDVADENRNQAIIAGLTQLVSERKFKSRDVAVSVSGQSVLTRFMKLPATEQSKIRQMVQYEAAQNVPFPIEEVVWDFQVVGSKRESDLDVVLVAIKRDIVEGIHACIKEAGLNVTLIEVAPLALYNAVLFNVDTQEGCSLVVDIGSRTTNLIFIESGKIFTRSIPIAGNTITQSVAQEFEVPFAEADDLKVRQGFVGLGGAYEEPELESAAKLSKIIRNVMTRLHAEVARSINFYKNQQAGKPPSRILLSGGTSIIPYADHFFKEKMEIEIEYFNPFANVPIDVQAESLEKVAQSMGEVVGLGLRQVGRCPAEINLLPAAISQKQNFSKKVPFFIVSLVGVLCILLSWWLYYWKWTSMLGNYRDEVERELTELRQVNSDLEAAKANVGKLESQVRQVDEVVKARYYWLDFLEDLNSRVPKIPDQDIWITALIPQNQGQWINYNGGMSQPAGAPGGSQPAGSGGRVFNRFGGGGGSGQDSSASTGAMPGASKKGILEFEIVGVCRNKSDSKEPLKPVDEFRNSLKGSPYFHSVEFLGSSNPQPTDYTFQFRLKAVLKTPIIY